MRAHENFRLHRFHFYLIPQKLHLMKSLLTLAALALSAGAATAQCCSAKGGKAVELAAGYSSLTPTGSLASHMGNLNALKLQGTLLAPCNRLGVGFDFLTGGRAPMTQIQEFGLNAGELTPTDVTYRSTVTTVSATVRYSVLRTQYFDAFAGVKGGLANFSSSVEVHDEISSMPDPYGCGPMPSANIASRSDNTWQAGANVGATMDIKALVKSSPRNTFLLQAHAGAIRGGKAAHIMPAGSAAAGHSHHATSATDGGAPVEMQFVDYSNGATQSHRHEVAREYSSPVQFFEAGLSLAVRF